jgi:hypothetical protein
MGAVADRIFGRKRPRHQFAQVRRACLRSSRPSVRSVIPSRSHPTLLPFFSAWKCFKPILASAAAAPDRSPGQATAARPRAHAQVLTP